MLSVLLFGMQAGLGEMTPFPRNYFQEIYGNLRKCIV